MSIHLANVRLLAEEVAAEVLSPPPPVDLEGWAAIYDAIPDENPWQDHLPPCRR